MASGPAKRPKRKRPSIRGGRTWITEVFLVLCLAPFAGIGAFGMRDVLARVLPVEEVSVVVVGRDKHLNADRDESYTLELEVPEGTVRSISVNEQAYEEAAHTDLIAVTLRQSFLLDYPMAIAFGSKSVRENGLIPEGGILDQVIPADDPRQDENISLLPPHWGVGIGLIAIGWGSIAAGAFHRSVKATIRERVFRPRWVFVGLAVVSLATMHWM